LSSAQRTPPGGASSPGAAAGAAANAASAAAQENRARGTRSARGDEAAAAEATISRRQLGIMYIRGLVRDPQTLRGQAYLVCAQFGRKNVRIFITSVICPFGPGLACPAGARGQHGPGQSRSQPVNGYICIRTAPPRRKFRGPISRESRNSGEIRTNRCGAP
jgi:hypothetical protein